jgi:phosphatidate cytidylyltransferase
MNDRNDDEGNEPSEAPTEQVRIVTSDEAEDALRSGRAVGRRSKRDLEAASPDVVELGHPNYDGGIVTQTDFSSLAGSDDEDDSVNLREPALVHNRSEDTMQLPHWSEPPTGEIPKIFGEKEASNGPEGPVSRTAPSEASNSAGRGWTDGSGTSLSDLGRASGLGSSSSSGVSSEPPVTMSPTTLKPGGDIEASDKTSSGSGSDKPGDKQADLGQHDKIDTATAFEGPEVNEDPVLGRTRDGVVGEERPLDTLSFVKRVITGSAVAIAALFAFAAGPAWVLVLVSAVLLFAAVEYFDALRRVGFRPATALGLLAVAGAVMGAYARGEQALALIVGLTLFFSFVWYLTGVLREAPTANIAVTMLGVIWIGVMGAYAALLLRLPEREGVAFLLGAVLLTIAYDTAAYVGGSLFGKHKLAPSISPSKSWEGLAAGTAASLLVGALLISFISPWTVISGLVVGALVAVVAPIGDFAESMIKRDLGLKDMGRILPGHGGVLDRFDALLFVLPATYYAVAVLGI